MINYFTSFSADAYWMDTRRTTAGQ